VRQNRVFARGLIAKLPGQGAAFRDGHTTPVAEVPGLELLLHGALDVWQVAAHVDPDLQFGRSAGPDFEHDFESVLAIRGNPCQDNSATLCLPFHDLRALGEPVLLGMRRFKETDQLLRKPHGELAR